MDIEKIEKIIKDGKTRQDKKCWCCGVLIMKPLKNYGPLRCSDCSKEKSDEDDRTT